MKKLLVVSAILLMAVFFAFGSLEAASPKPTSSFNHWLYLNLNLNFTPQWSLHVMPGHSYQYSFDNPNTPGEDDATGTFLTELFIGPWYSTKLTDSLSLKMGVEYYFMGFRTADDQDELGDWYNHCIEVIPVLSYKINDQFSLSSRTIFHNVLQTTEKESVPNSESVDGWGMLIREMIGVHYNLNSLITLSLSNEFFYGVREKDGLTTTSLYTKGYNENRIIPGITFKNLAPGLSITTNYIYRTSFNTADDEPKAGFDHYDIYDTKHYIQLILSYNYNMY